MKTRIKSQGTDRFKRNSHYAISGLPIYMMTILLIAPVCAFSGSYLIDHNMDWSALSPQPTASDTIYINNKSKLNIDVNNAGCAVMYIGYEDGINDGQGSLEFAGSSALTIGNGGIVVGSLASKGEVNMSKGGTLTTPSISVMNPAGKFKAGKGTIILVGNNTLPAEFSKLYNLIVSTGTTTLSADIQVKGDLTINGTLDVSSSSYRIDIKGDWINNSAFIANSGLVKFSGDKEQWITGSNPTVYHSLQLDKEVAKKGKDAGVTLSISISVMASFDLTQGILYTDSLNYVTLGPDATTSGGSDASYVNGRIKIETDTIKTIVITTGKNGKFKKSVLSTQSPDTSAFISEYFDEPLAYAGGVGGGISHVCSMEYWEMIRVKGNASATITLIWNTAECGPMDLIPALRVARFDTVAWVSEGSSDISGDPGNGSITSDTLKGYGCFTFGCDHGSLRMAGGSDNFSGPAEESSDHMQEPMKAYLSQVKIEQNTNIPIYDLDMVVVPNPSHGAINVVIKETKNEEVLIVVQDMLGRTHYSKVIFPEDDTYNLAVDPSEKLSPGVYLVVGSSENARYKKKVVIQ